MKSNRLNNLMIKQVPVRLFKAQDRLPHHRRQRPYPEHPQNLLQLAVDLQRLYRYSHAALQEPEGRRVGSIPTACIERGGCWSANGICGVPNQARR